MIQVNEILRAANQKIIEFKNDDWLLEIEIDEYLNPNFLQNLKTGQVSADERYLYQLEVQKNGIDGYQGDDKKASPEEIENLLKYGAFAFLDNDGDEE